MLSLSLTTWVHRGRQTSRIVLGHTLGRELSGPTNHLAEAANIPLTGPPQPCEECEMITPYAELRALADGAVTHLLRGVSGRRHQTLEDCMEEGMDEG